MGGVLYGTIQDATGNTLFAGLEINMNYPRGSLGDGIRNPIGIFYIENNKKHYLFF